MTSPNLTAEFDQMGASLGGFADTLGTYRARLTAAGIPAELADRVVLDVAQRCHHRWYITREDRP